VKITVGLLKRYFSGKLGSSYTVGGMTKDVSNRPSQKILKIMNLPVSRIGFVTDDLGTIVVMQ
jgi:hypothetical protein